ncbi:MAG TPA: hypothetical protein ACYCC8_00585 [Candidatus Azoamicus sp.]
MKNNKIDELEKEYISFKNLELQLTYPKNENNIIELNKTYSNIKKNLSDYIYYKKIIKEINDLSAIITKSDKELNLLIENELIILNEKKFL